MYISPMLLQTADSPFHDCNFVFELKNNAVRLLYNNQSIYTRHRTVLNDRLPELSDITGLRNYYLNGDFVCFNDDIEDVE